MSKPMSKEYRAGWTDALTILEASLDLVVEPSIPCKSAYVEQFKMLIKSLPAPMFTR